MNADKLAEIMTRFANELVGLAEEIRQANGIPPVPDDYDADRDFDNDHNGNEVDDDAPPAAQPRIADGPAQATMLQVNAGDLWRLVNRSRKMIRFARQGKIPTQTQRAPLCRVIKRLKAQGLAKKPRDLQDID